LLERRGLGPDGDPDIADALRRDQPLLAELYGASVEGRIAVGPRAGHRVMTLGDSIDGETRADTAKPLCANLSGFSLHANVCIPARARRQLEKLCRYTARPPVATDRLSLRRDSEGGFPEKHRIPQSLVGRADAAGLGIGCARMSPLFRSNENSRRGPFF
jgi:hypothetical protein